VGKIRVDEMVFGLLLLLVPFIAQFGYSGTTGPVVGAVVDRAVKVLIFDGFKLAPVSPVNRDTETIKSEIPVTGGGYFVLFFVRDNYIPEVKILRAGRENIELGRIMLEEMTEGDRGFLIGVAYKAVGGGKVSPRKGIKKLIGELCVRVLNDKGEEYLAKTRDDGTYRLSLDPGRYRIFLPNSKEGISVVVGKRKTTIQNLQRGVMLID
jgi:hypothetical protein